MVGFPFFCLIFIELGLQPFQHVRYTWNTHTHTRSLTGVVSAYLGEYIVEYKQTQSEISQRRKKIVVHKAQQLLLLKMFERLSICFSVFILGGRIPVSRRSGKDFESSNSRVFFVLMFGCTTQTFALYLASHYRADFVIFVWAEWKPKKKNLINDLLHFYTSLCIEMTVFVIKYLLQNSEPSFHFGICFTFIYLY